MNTLITVLCVVALTAGSHALADVTQDPPSSLPNVCYETLEGGQFCTAQHLGDVQVFVYNAGWCGPCNSEMAELSTAFSQFAGKAVTFASLSGEGWKRGTQPDKVFMEAWQKKHKIPFVVAGKFRDFGTPFEPTGFIPFAVIADQAGNIVKKGSLSADEIVSTVKQLLNK